MRLFLKNNLFFAGLLLSTFAFAQDQNFSEIDAHALEVPETAESNINSLAEYLTQNSETDLEKARALFIWMTDNIRYDVKLLNSSRLTAEQRYERQQANKVLKAKMGVCEGYTNLYHELCVAAGLQSEKVTGYAKPPGQRVSRLGHAWNILKIDDEWKLIDNTWGAGTVDDVKNRYKKNFNEDFFLVDPKDHILTHFPNDPLFQMLPQPVPWNAFTKNDHDIKVALANGAAVEEPFLEYYMDTLNFYNQLDSADKIINSCHRMLRFDPKNGYANYLIGKVYFKNGQAKSRQFRKVAEKAAKEQIHPTQSQWNTWSNIAVEMEKYLNLSVSYLNKVPSTDKFYGNAKGYKKNVGILKKNLSNNKSWLRQMKQFIRG